MLFRSELANEEADGLSPREKTERIAELSPGAEGEESELTDIEEEEERQEPVETDTRRRSMRISKPK